MSSVESEQVILSIKSRVTLLNVVTSSKRVSLWIMQVAKPNITVKHAYSNILKS